MLIITNFFLTKPDFYCKSWDFFSMDESSNNKENQVMIQNVTTSKVYFLYRSNTTHSLFFVVFPPLSPFICACSFFILCHVYFKEKATVSLRMHSRGCAKYSTLKHIEKSLGNCFLSAFCCSLILRSKHWIFHWV